MTDLDPTILSDLVALYESGDNNVMEMGWTSVKLLDALVDQEKAAGDENPCLRPIITALLDELAGQGDMPGKLSAHFSSIKSARQTIADRLRVMRFFDKTRLAELPGKPTFNHCRAMYRGGDWPEADVEETETSIYWAITHSKDGKYPTPDVIRHRGAKSDENPNERQFRVLREAAQRVANNPEQSKRRREAAQKVIEVE